MTKEEVLNLINNKEERTKIMERVIKVYNTEKDFDIIGVCPSEKGLNDFCENNSCETCWELSLKHKLWEIEQSEKQ